MFGSLLHPSWGGMTGLPGVRSMMEEFNEIESAMNKAFFTDHSGSVLKPVSLPRVDVAEYPAEFKITIDLPGMQKDDVEVRMDDSDGDRILSIVAEHDEEKVSEEEGDDENKPKWHMKERSTTSFCRSFAIPDKAETDKIGAKMVDGALTVTVPKKPEEIEKEKSPHRTIEIE